MKPVEQILFFKDWQAIFPSNWQRVKNPDLNQACEQIEAIYRIDFQPSALFDKNGESLFFNHLRYQPDNQLICHGSANPEPDTAGQTENTQTENTRQDKKGSHCISLQRPPKKTGHGAYRIEGVEIHTLSDFISQYHLVSGILPEWKPSVWKTLAKLKQQLSAS
jgi:hypothetical protein